jgi:hypothetical protein
MKRMKIFGKVHWLVALGIVGILVLAAIMLTGGESPQSRGAAFMSALAEGDAKKLASLSYVEGMSDAEIEAEWEETVSRSKYYRFMWRPLSMVQQDQEQAAMKMFMVRNPGPSSYEENFQISLQKVDGKWKVLPNTLSREAFPFLPRF